MGCGGRVGIAVLLLAGWVIIALFVGGHMSRLQDPKTATIAPSGQDKLQAAQLYKLQAAQDELVLQVKQSNTLLSTLQQSLRGELHRQVESRSFASKHAKKIAVEAVFRKLREKAVQQEIKDGITGLQRSVDALHSGMLSPRKQQEIAPLTWQPGNSCTPLDTLSTEAQDAVVHMKWRSLQRSALPKSQAALALPLPLPAQELTQHLCNPDTQGGHCCSSFGFCGSSEEHCRCDNCVDSQQMAAEIKLLQAAQNSKVPVVPDLIPYDDEHVCSVPLSFNRSTSPGGEAFAGFDVVITWLNSTMQAGCNDEMRYLLRSLSSYGMYPQHVRKVFVVVADEHYSTCHAMPPPNYLIEGQSQLIGPLGVHPSLRVVRHSEVFEAAHIPTESRDAILAAVPKIKGLGEWFFRFDDDMTLAKPFDINDWFDPQTLQLKLHFDTSMSEWEACKYAGDPKKPMIDEVRDTQYKRVMWQSNKVLHDKFGPPPTTTSERDNSKGCRKAPPATDHSALLHNKCIDLIARQMFAKEFAETDKGLEGEEIVHMNTVMYNLAFQFGLGVWVGGGSQWNGKQGHFALHTNGWETFKQDAFKTIFTSKSYRDANFQGPGISMEYATDKQFRTTVYEPAMRSQFAEVFDLEHAPHWNATHDLEAHCLQPLPNKTKPGPCSSREKGGLLSRD